MKDTEPVRFTETQAFPIWGYVVLGLAAAASLGNLLGIRSPGWLGAWSVFLFGLTFNLMCLRTQVSETQMTVTFGALFPLYRRRVALVDIASAEAVTYSPMTEYGGWGIRGRGGNTALSARGNRGVRLTLRDGSRVLIGSQKPEMLAEALTAPR